MTHTTMAMLSDYVKTFIHYQTPKKALTSVAGYLANLEKPFIKNQLIRYFIRKYDVNMAEALEENPLAYRTFNAFFIRRLKPACRPIATTGITSPVDGCISEIGRINKGQLLQAKGRYYSVGHLLACESSLSAQFENGHFATLYLSPKDYHRVHMPINATLREMIYVPGELFSVQPTTARMVPQLFARNERLVIFFDTAIGLMAMVLVGATIVGGIATTWQGDVIRSNEYKHFYYNAADEPAITLQKADEMGYFKLGSTVILLFANNAPMQWLASLSKGQPIRLGEGLATIVGEPADK